MKFTQYIKEENEPRNITSEDVEVYREEIEKHINSLSDILSRYKRDVWYMAHDNGDNKTEYSNKYIDDTIYGFEKYFVKSYYKNIGKLENDIKYDVIPKNK